MSEENGEPPACIDDVLVTSHAADRFDRHCIDEGYVDELLSATGGWEQSYDRLVSTVARDGVLWKVVVDHDDFDAVSYDWDLVTVYPDDVDVDAAKESGLWADVEVLNLAFYADG